MPAVEGRGSAGDGRKAPFSAGKGEKRQFLNGFFAFFCAGRRKEQPEASGRGGASGSRRAGGGRPERGARKRAEALPEGALRGGNRAGARPFFCGKGRSRGERERRAREGAMCARKRGPAGAGTAGSLREGIPGRAVPQKRTLRPREGRYAAGKGDMPRKRRCG